MCYFLQSYVDWRECGGNTYEVQALTQINDVNLRILQEFFFIQF